MGIGKVGRVLFSLHQVGMWHIFLLANYLLYFFFFVVAIYCTLMPDDSFISSKENISIFFVSRYMFCHGLHEFHVHWNVSKPLINTFFSTSELLSWPIPHQCYHIVECIWWLCFYLLNDEILLIIVFSFHSGSWSWWCLFFFLCSTNKKRTYPMLKSLWSEINCVVNHH